MLAFFKCEKTSYIILYGWSVASWHFLFCSTHRQTIAELHEKDLPELRNKLQSVNREIEKFKRDIEEQESLLSLLMSEEDTAKACLQDISLMDRYQVWGHSGIIKSFQYFTKCRKYSVWVNFSSFNFLGLI